jgi:hypothetical protein
MSNWRSVQSARGQVSLGLGLMLLAALAAACGSGSGRSLAPGSSSMSSTGAPSVCPSLSVGPETSVGPERSAGSEASVEISASPEASTTAGPKVSATASPKPAGPKVSAPTGAAPTPTPAPTAAPGATFRTDSSYCDNFGYGSVGMALSNAGYVSRNEGLITKAESNAALALVEPGLSKLVDLNKVQSGDPTLSGDAFVLWVPQGYCAAGALPSRPGERIYEINVDLGPLLRGGHAVAQAWFVSPETLGTTPTQYRTYRVDDATADALFDLFWVKATPAES